jgi:hypothetical protein
MQLVFERGDSTTPRGHALVYFRESSESSHLRASYLVVAPIEMDFAKYVPPMFAAQFSGLMPSGPTAMPLPPIPEPVASLTWLTRLAEARDDDLIDGGQVDANAPQSMLMVTSELAGRYAALWADYAARLDRSEPDADVGEPAALPDVDALLMSVLSDTERVARLAKLAGTLRYALEVADNELRDETVAGMERIGSHLPTSYRFNALLAAGRKPDPASGQLLQLYVERAYKLAAEEYHEVERLDREIFDRGGASTG